MKILSQDSLSPKQDFKPGTSLRCRSATYSDVTFNNNNPTYQFLLNSTKDMLKDGWHYMQV
jgi:hypothetical protein